MHNYSVSDDLERGSRLLYKGKLVKEMKVRTPLLKIV